MVFSSPLFLLYFLPIFLTAYFISRSIYTKNVLIAIFSIIFYTWGEPVFILYILCGCLIDWISIKYVFTNEFCSYTLKRLVLSGLIILNLFALGFFKYAGFFIDQVESVISLLGFKHSATIDVLLPLGISFICFHKISLLVDVYKKKAEPPSSFMEVLVYILLFPQLVAGPIIRLQDIIAEIKTREIQQTAFVYGFARFTLGLAKKLLLADPVGEVSDLVFEMDPTKNDYKILWLGALAYTFQIYFDFSAYSDMAIGIAAMLGFNFKENFNKPYLSITVTDFWKRWHISLSRWMREYLYIPLGGNRSGMVRQMLNLWIVFLFSGLWHGAAWNFVIWGGYYGLFLSIERICKIDSTPRNNYLNILLWVYTAIVVIFGWVIFRSESLSYALQYLHGMVSVQVGTQDNLTKFNISYTNIHQYALIASGLLIAFSYKLKWSILQGSNTLVILAIAAASLLLYIILTAYTLTSTYSPFLYFKF